jgi:hypothetical protein
MTVAIVWPLSRHSVNQSPLHAGPQPTSDSLDAPKAVRSFFKQASVYPVPGALADTMASLHSKMRLWQESLVTDADDEEDRARLVREMLALVTDENVAEIVQSLSVEEMTTPFGAGALHHWMQADPLKATDWVATRPETTDEQTLAVADDWMATSQGMQACIDQLPSTEWKQTFLADLGSEMSVKDPQSAIGLAQQMAPGKAQENLLQSVACNWVETDPNAALSWVAGVSDPELRDNLVASAVQAYALVDPAQAATWIVSEVKSGQVINDAAVNITESWAAKDPAAAAKWVALFPSGDTRASAVNTLLVHWLQSDRSAAVNWIQSLPEGTSILAGLHSTSQANSSH